MRPANNVEVQSLTYQYSIDSICWRIWYCVVFWCVICWLKMTMLWYENIFCITCPLLGESMCHWYQMVIWDFSNWKSRYRYWKIWCCSNALYDHRKIHIWLCVNHVDGSVQDCSISIGDTAVLHWAIDMMMCINHMTIMCSVIIPLHSF